MVTPSHNPPADGGFKYNPPHGGPADTDATSWIADRANQLLEADLAGVARTTLAKARAADTTSTYDFLDRYVADLPSVLDLDAIRASGLHIGADPLGGAAVDYWGEIGERFGLDLTVVNPLVDGTFRFMTLDWDGKIRMDCSSPSAMASLIARKGEYVVATGNDADSDRHGIVTADGGLMNPNHYLAVAIQYLFAAREGWPAGTAIGKTLVSSSMIDRVAADLGRTLLEVPVGFKWFVPGLIDASIGFGGEESAGASFLRRDGSVWTTDKDGILLALLASEITAVTGRTPSEHYRDLTERFGDPAYARTDVAATREQKAVLGRLSPEQVTATELAGEPIVARLTHGAGQRSRHRRAQGDHGERLVRRAPERHRGRLQGLCRELPRPGPPGRGAGRGPRGRLSRPRHPVTLAARLISLSSSPPRSSPPLPRDQALMAPVVEGPSVLDHEEEVGVGGRRGVGPADCRRRPRSRAPATP